MSTRLQHHRAWLAGLTLLLAGCASEALAPRTELDPGSGVTLTVVDEPMVLARERRDVAVHARDYLTLIAAEVNESGRRRLIWVAHQWSTIDSRVADSPVDRTGQLLLLADGRDMRMNPIGGSTPAAYLQHRSLAPPDDVKVVTTIYPVDASTLDYVAHSARLSAFLPDSGLAIGFGLWRDGRPALLRLMSAIQP